MSSLIPAFSLSPISQQSARANGNSISGNVRAAVTRLWVRHNVQTRFVDNKPALCTLVCDYTRAIADAPYVYVAGCCGVKIELATAASAHHRFRIVVARWPLGVQL